MSNKVNIKQFIERIVEKVLQETNAKTQLSEGVYDQGILKAIFLVGGPGSGKSYVMKQIFGVDGKTTFSRHGLKLVTPDPTFEKLLARAGVDPGDLDKISTDDPDRYASEIEPLRQRAKDVEGRMEANYLAGRMGVIIEGTGKNVGSSKRFKEKLEALGYDCFLAFVNTDLETAKARNKRRSRTIPEKALVDLWSQAQSNLGDLQRLFGAVNTLIIDNSADVKLGAEISKSVEQFIRRPLKNPIGKQWVKDELKKKDRR